MNQHQLAVERLVKILQDRDIDRGNGLLLLDAVERALIDAMDEAGFTLDEARKAVWSLQFVPFVATVTDALSAYERKLKFNGEPKPK